MSTQTTDPSAFWAHQAILDIFQLTLKRGESSRFVLESMVNAPTLLSADSIEGIIVERLTEGGWDALNLQGPVEYLVTAYNRAAEEARSTYTQKREDRMALLKQIRECCVSYVGLSILHQDMFPTPPRFPKSVLQLVPLIEVNYGEHNELSDDFLRDFITRFKDEGLQEVFAPVFVELSVKMRKMTILDNFFPTFRAMLRLTAFVELARILTTLPTWIAPIKNGSSMEKFSILGPFFALTTFYDTPIVGEQYFKDVTNRQMADIEASMRSLRFQLKLIHETLHKIMLNLLKPKDTREAVINWIAAVIDGNRGRSKMQVDVFSTATDGFMANFCAVLLMLSAPFLDKEKIKGVDSDFVLSSKLIDFSADTKLAASSKDVASWVDKKNYSRAQAWAATSSSVSIREKETDIQNKTFNFVTQCFFFTYAALYLGYMKTVDKYDKLMRRLSNIQQAYYSLRDSQPAWAALPDAPMREQQMNDLKGQMSQLLTIKFAADTQLMHAELMQNVHNFYYMSCYWVLRVADPDNVVFPLTEPVPMDYASLPEYFIDDVSNFMIFMLRFDSQSVLGTSPSDTMVNLMTTMMGNSKYIVNPYMRAKFVEVFAAMIPSKHVSLPPAVVSVFTSNEFVKEHLLEGLMKIYVDIEHTGSHTQFFDKFTPRFYAAKLLKYLWQFDAYREAFAKQTRNEDVFLRFFNMLLNDATYLLDESLKCLHEIRSFQLQFANQSQWQAQPENVRREKEQLNEQHERQVQSWLQLANETVHMLQYLSKDIPDPFMRPEMVQRVAAMLNYFLVELAGPRCADLKVENPKKYKFDPKYLLTEITTTYVHFKAFPQFIEAVAGDGRSYKPELFDRVIGILRTRLRLPDHQVGDFESLAIMTKEAAQRAQEEETDLGDIPDEFLDPVTYTLMKDPVILPSSRQVMDRSSISRHLLSDMTDPFNRSHLTPEMLIPDTELKQKIEEFVQSKKRK